MTQKGLKGNWVKILNCTRSCKSILEITSKTFCQNVTANDVYVDFSNINVLKKAGRRQKGDESEDLP